MTTAFLRILVAASGLVLLWMSFSTYVKKKMTEGIGLAWGIFSIFLFLLGALPGLSVWTKYIVGKGAVALFCLVIFVLFGAFSLSSTVSRLVMKNRELAMQVSLLNQEYEQMIRQLERMQQFLQEETED